MDKTLAGHLSAIQSGQVTKTNVIGLRKAINHAERLSNGWSGNRCNADPEDVWEVEAELEQAKPRVTGDLHDTGLAVLRNKRYAKRWSDWQLEAITHLDHFRLVGFDRIGSQGMYAVPIYEVWAKAPPKGDALDNATYQAFQFTNVPWQSGGDGPRVYGNPSDHWAIRAARPGINC